METTCVYLVWCEFASKDMKNVVTQLEGVYLTTTGANIRVGNVAQFHSSAEGSTWVNGKEDQKVTFTDGSRVRVYKERVPFGDYYGQ